MVVVTAEKERAVAVDAETDTYLVSNINGSPLAKDNNGYVAEFWWGLAAPAKTPAARAP